MNYYIVTPLNKNEKTVKVIARYGCSKLAFSHKDRLEKDQKYKNLEVHASTKSLVKNQIVKLSELHI